MKLRAGSRVVWIGTTMRQSASAATGWMRPWALASHSVTSSRARSITSVCGYSFIETSTSALLHHRRCQVHVRVELGAHDHLGPHHGAHPGQHVAFAVVVALRHHRAVQAQQHHVHRQRAAQVGQQLVTQLLVGFARDGAAGLGARDHALDQASSRAAGATSRKAHSGPEKNVNSFGCCPAGK